MRHFILAILILAMILLPPISAQATPAENQTWTEEPWSIADAQESQKSGSATLSAPIAFNISGSEPSKIRLGDLEMNYTDYSSQPGSSELWIKKKDSWSRYEQVVQGDEADLIAYAPKDGNADLYLISYANSTIAHWSFSFLKGYHLLRLVPEDPGRLFMILAVNSRPGNALILDVQSRPAKEASAPVDVRTVLPGYRRWSFGRHSQLHPGGRQDAYHNRLKAGQPGKYQQERAHEGLQEQDRLHSDHRLMGQSCGDRLFP
jgi:hypothetical protein